MDSGDVDPSSTLWTKNLDSITAKAVGRATQEILNGATESNVQSENSSAPFSERLQSMKSQYEKIIAEQGDLPYVDKERYEKINGVLSTLNNFHTATGVDGNPVKYSPIPLDKRATPSTISAVMKNVIRAGENKRFIRMGTNADKLQSLSVQIGDMTPSDTPFSYLKRAIKTTDDLIKEYTSVFDYAKDNREVAAVKAEVSQLGDYYREMERILATGNQRTLNGAAQNGTLSTFLKAKADQNKLQAHIDQIQSEFDGTPFVGKSRQIQAEQRAQARLDAKAIRQESAAAMRNQKKTINDLERDKFFAANLLKGDETSAKVFVANMFAAKNTIDPTSIFKDVSFLRKDDVLPNGQPFGEDRGYTDRTTGKIYLNRDALIDEAATTEYVNTPGAFSKEHVYMDKNKVRETFLHEVMHTNIDVLGDERYKKLVALVKKWARLKKGITEVEVGIYKRAVKRLEAKHGKVDVDQGVYDAELLAYATEEAIAAGIEPDGLTRTGSVKNLLSQLAQLFTDVLKKLIPDFKGNLTANELVTISYALAGMRYDSKTNHSKRYGLLKVAEDLNKTNKPIEGLVGKEGFYSSAERKKANLTSAFEDLLSETPFDPEAEENQLPDSRLYMFGRLVSDSSMISISALELEDGSVQVETLDDSSGTRLYENHTFTDLDSFYAWSRDRGYVINKSMTVNTNEVPRPGVTYRNANTPEGLVNTNEGLVKRSMLLNDNLSKFLNKLTVIPGSEMFLDHIASLFTQANIKAINADGLIYSMMQAVKGAYTSDEVTKNVNKAVQAYEMEIAKNRASLRRTGDTTMTTFDRRQSILDSIRELSSMGLNEFDIENSMRAMFAQQEALLNTKDAYAGLNNVPITNQTAFHWSPELGNIKPDDTAPTTYGSYDGKRMKMVDDKDGSLFISKLSQQQFEVVKQLADKMIQMNDAVLDAEYASKIITKDTYDNFHGKLYLPMREPGVVMTKTGLSKEARVTRSGNNTIESLFSSVTARSNSVARNNGYRGFGEILRANPIPTLATVNVQTAGVTSIEDLENLANDSGYEGSWVYLDDGRRVVITPTLKEHRELLKRVPRNTVLEKIAATQRFGSIVRVMLSPAVQTSMLLRDSVMAHTNLQYAFPKLTNDEAMKVGNALIKKGVMGMRTLFKSRGGTKPLTENTDSVWFKKEYDAAGGGITLGARYGYDTANRDVLSAIDDGSQAKTFRHVKEIADGAKRGLLGVLHVVEDVYRFGAYQAYIELKHGGKFDSQEQLRTYLELNPDVSADATLGSKRLLGDFDKRGTTQTGPALMMFFNATMQGNKSFVGALNTPHGKRMVLSFALLVLATTMIDIGEEEEDESGKSLSYRRTKRGGLVGFGDFWFPAPPELRGLTTAVKNIAYLSNGDMDVGEFALSSSLGLLQTFSPVQIENIQGSDNAIAVPLLSFVPVLAHGVAKTALDVNSFGGKLTNDAVYDKEGRKVKNPAEFMKINQSDADWAVAAAEGIYRYTGFDNSPASIEAQADAALGSVYNSMIKPALGVATGKMDTVDALNKAVNPLRNPSYKAAVDDDFEKVTKGIYADANLGDVRMGPKGRNILMDTPETALRKEALKVTKDASNVKIGGVSMAEAIRKKEQAREAEDYIRVEQMDALITQIGERKRQIKGDFLRKINEGEFE